MAAEADRGPSDMIVGEDQKPSDMVEEHILKPHPHVEGETGIVNPTAEAGEDVNALLLTELPGHITEKKETQPP